MIKNMRASVFDWHLVFQGLFVILAADSICLIAATGSRLPPEISWPYTLYKVPQGAVHSIQSFDANTPLGVLAQRSVLST